MTSRHSPLAAWAAGLTVVAAVATVLTFFLPWARSGRAWRSGFALARAVDAVGLADRPGLRGLLVAFWFAPMLAALSWTAAATGRRAAAGVLGALVGLVGASAAVLVVRASAVRPGSGAWAGMVTGALALVAGVVAWRGRRANGRRRRDQMGFSRR